MTNQIKVPVTALSNMITSVILAASKDATLPTINCVYIEWMKENDAGVLIMTATDRYQLLNAKLAIPAPEGQESVAFLIHFKDLADLVKSLPKVAKYEEEPVVTIGYEPNKITFDWTTGTTFLETYDGEFPKYRTIMQHKSAAAPVISFNVKYLANLAKVKSDTRWRFEFTGAHRPVFAYSTDLDERSVQYIYMFMPIRLT